MCQRVVKLNYLYAENSHTVAWNSVYWAVYSIVESFQRKTTYNHEHLLNTNSPTLFEYECWRRFYEMLNVVCTPNQAVLFYDATSFADLSELTCIELLKCMKHKILSLSHLYWNTKYTLLQFLSIEKISRRSQKNKTTTQKSNDGIRHGN